MTSSYSTDGVLKRVITIVAPDISFVIICPKCMKDCSITDDAVKNGRYDMVLKFLAEHDHVARNDLKRVRAIDREKVAKAAELLKGAIL